MSVCEGAGGGGGGAGWEGRIEEAGGGQMSGQHLGIFSILKLRINCDLLVHMPHTNITVHKAAYLIKPMVERCSSGQKT